MARGGRPEITVRGAGIFGLSVAWACAARGARVRVIDPGGVGAGASGGVVGALAPHTPDAWTDGKAFQLRALLAQADWWAGVQAAGGGDAGYARAGRVQPLADAAAVALAQARAAAAAQTWGGAATWQVVPAPDGWGPVTATGLVVRDTLSARLSPRGALAALAAAIRAQGGEVLRDGAASGAVVEATGAAGLATLGADLGRAVGRGVKGQAARLALAGVADLPQVYGQGLHVVPHADGTVAVGSTTEADFADPTATDAALDAVIAAARALVPALAAAPVVERWAGVRPRAASRLPVLGAWPGRPGRFVANGGFKTGFGLAPLVGTIMADLVLDGADRIPDALRLQGSATSTQTGR